MKSLITTLLLLPLTTFASSSSSCTYKFSSDLLGKLDAYQMTELRKNLREFGAKYDVNSSNILGHQYENLGNSTSYNPFTLLQAGEFGEIEQHRDTYTVRKSTDGSIVMNIVKSREHNIVGNYRSDENVVWDIDESSCEPFESESIRTSSLKVGDIVPVKIVVDRSNDWSYAEFKILEVRQTKYSGGEAYRVELLDPDTDISSWRPADQDLVLRDKWLWPIGIKQEFLKAQFDQE